MNRIFIRPARSSERFELIDLLRRATLTLEEVREQLLSKPELMDIPAETIAAGQVFAAERDGRLAGVATMLLREDGDAELDGLFVDPADWRVGIGTMLVHAVEDAAVRQGARRLHVLADRMALGFYLACGFEKYGEQPTLLGPVAVLMIKSLAAA